MLFYYSLVFWLYSELHHNNKGKQDFTSHTQNVVNKEHFCFIRHATIITPTFMFSKYTIVVVLYIQQAHSLHYDTCWRQWKHQTTRIWRKHPWNHSIRGDMGSFIACRNSHANLTMQVNVVVGHQMLHEYNKVWWTMYVEGEWSSGHFSRNARNVAK